jgi:hypothetical protein
LDELAEEMMKWRWPVLFWLSTARREHNLHEVLADTETLIPVAMGPEDEVRT